MINSGKMTSSAPEHASWFDLCLWLSPFEGRKELQLHLMLVIFSGRDGSTVKNSDLVDPLVVSLGPK